MQLCTWKWRRSDANRSATRVLFALGRLHVSPSCCAPMDSSWLHCSPWLVTTDNIAPTTLKRSTKPSRSSNSLSSHLPCLCVLLLLTIIPEPLYSTTSSVLRLSPFFVPLTALVYFGSPARCSTC